MTPEVLLLFVVLAAGLLLALAVLVREWRRQGPRRAREIRSPGCRFSTRASPWP